VSELVSYGVDAATIRVQGEAVDRFIHDLVEKWRALRPGVALACRRQGTEPVPHIAVDSGLRHAVLNLLNNAADASSRGIEMVSTWTPVELRILVLDRGPGIAPELADVLGKQLVSTKRDRGTGVGLLLAKTAIERAGGSLQLCNRPDGGACAEVVLPLGAAAGPRESRAAVAAPPLRVRYFHSGARRS
jgi:two-component system sensor histidine kinase RegB